MTDDQRIDTYLQHLRASLEVPRSERARVIEEIEHHLRDASLDHQRHGRSQRQAIALAIDELGAPEDVAAAFNDAAPGPDPRRGIARWLPLVVPLTLLAARLGALAWSTTFLVGGTTTGERTLQTAYARACITPALLSIVGVWAIRSADRDPRWRRLAWACSAAAIVVVVAPHLPT